MTSDGSAYVRFKRALKIGNELLVLTATQELPRIALDDALRICLVLRHGDPDRYQRAAVRGLGRFALDAHDVPIKDLRLAVEALNCAIRRRSARVRRRPVTGASLLSGGMIAGRICGYPFCGWCGF